MLPLYDKDSIAWEKLFNKADTAHIGLLFDKFPHGEGWADKEKDFKLADEEKKEEKGKKGFFNQIIGKYDRVKQTQLAQHLNTTLERQQCLIGQLGGLYVDVTTDWRMVSGLGASHPFETGFIWHRTLSVPYLPGSSVKGLLRAWAEQWGGSEDKEQINRLFGTGGDNDGQAGAIIVFDALPNQPPELDLDILNPHYSAYYQNPATTPPADYLDPSPVFFLAVAPGQSFRFFLAPRLGVYSKQANDDLETAKQLLINALVYLGIGAKTAVGYGQMTALEYQEKEQANNAQKWLDEVIESFRKHQDFKGQPEKVLWQNKLSEEWLFKAPIELKPLILELIKAKWVELGINWQQPSEKSAQKAKQNFMR